MIRQAIILAGGEGTRLRPVTLEIPKPLIPVQGLPVLSWQVRWLKRFGIERILVLVPQRWSSTFTHWQKDLPTEVELWEEREPLGTMGALVHELQDRLGDEAILVTNGDELKGLDVAALSVFHEGQRRVSPSYGASVALIEVSNPSDYGVAVMHGAHIEKFLEKPNEPPSRLVSSGLYIIESSVLKEADRSRKFLMFEKDLFPQLAIADRLGGCALSGPWFDCGTLERWEKAIKEWQEPI